jgi:uroporphyrinogen III methyltransferase/synthase
VAFVTGHEDPQKRAGAALDWEALARFPGTLVFYMGVRQLEAIAERLVSGGRDPGEAAAVVERGTLPDQRVVAGTLGTIAAVASAERVRAPALVVVGAVAALRERLAWFPSGAAPLSGVSVAVTRARAQASTLAARLRGLGASVVEAPAIRIVPLDGPAPEVGRYDLVCLTSPNGVRLLFERLLVAGLDARALAGARVAAIGPGTAAALRSFGVVADVVPSERFVAEGLVEALAEVPVARALVARAAEARDVLVEALRERGAEVDVVALYETVAAPLDAGQLAAVAEANYVTFTSSSTVRFLFDVAGDGFSPRGRLVSIGPVTSATLRERGLTPHVEATRHDIDGLVEALVADAAARERPG